MELLDAAFPLLHGAWATSSALVASYAFLSFGIWFCWPPPLLNSCGATPPETGVVASTNVEEACKGVDVAVMLGGFPRKAGMERKDVMSKNVSIYAAQAAALEKHANKGVKVRGGAATAATHTCCNTARRTSLCATCEKTNPKGHQVAPGMAQDVTCCMHGVPTSRPTTASLPVHSLHGIRSWWWPTPPTPTP